jgi:hypothetical protein
MSFPTSLITGTIAYLVFGAILVGGVFAMLATGMMSKDNARSVFSLSSPTLWPRVESVPRPKYQISHPTVSSLFSLQHSQCRVCHCNLCNVALLVSLSRLVVSEDEENVPPNVPNVKEALGNASQLCAADNDETVLKLTTLIVGEKSPASWCIYCVLSRLSRVWLDRALSVSLT